MHLFLFLNCNKHLIINILQILLTNAELSVGSASNTVVSNQQSTAVDNVSIEAVYQLSVALSAAAVNIQHELKMLVLLTIVI